MNEWIWIRKQVAWIDEQCGGLESRLLRSLERDKARNFYVAQKQLTVIKNLSLSLSLKSYPSSVPFIWHILNSKLPRCHKFRERECWSYLACSMRASDWCCSQQRHRFLLGILARGLNGTTAEGAEHILHFQTFWILSERQDQVNTFRVRHAGFWDSGGWSWVCLPFVLLVAFPRFCVCHAHCTLQHIRAGVLWGLRHQQLECFHPPLTVSDATLLRLHLSAYFCLSVSLLWQAPSLCPDSAISFSSLHFFLSMSLLFFPPFISLSLSLSFRVSPKGENQVSTNRADVLLCLLRALFSLSINSFLSPSGRSYLLYNQGRPELAAMNVRKSL